MTGGWEQMFLKERKFYFPNQGPSGGCSCGTVTALLGLDLPHCCHAIWCYTESEEGADAGSGVLERSPYSDQC